MKTDCTLALASARTQAIALPLVIWATARDDSGRFKQKKPAPAKVPRRADLRLRQACQTRIRTQSVCRVACEKYSYVMYALSPMVQHKDFMRQCIALEILHD
jgi:hypothetical protein